MPEVLCKMNNGIKSAIVKKQKLEKILYLPPEAWAKNINLLFIICYVMKWDEERDPIVVAEYENAVYFDRLWRVNLRVSLWLNLKGKYTLKY